MEVLLIPIIGASCLVAVLLLLVLSLCEHYRNADQIRIRFLKHSYRSIWLEAPGFCEVQHRNYIYSYQQSALMVSGVDVKRFSRPSVSSGGDVEANAVASELMQLSDLMHLSELMASSDGFDENNPPTENNELLPKYKGRQAAVSFEDEVTGASESEPSRTDSELPGPSSSSPMKPRRKLSTNRRLHQLVQQAGADVESMQLKQVEIADIAELEDEEHDDEHDDDIDEEEDDELSAGAVAATRTTVSTVELANIGESEISSQTHPVQRIHGVLQDFYQSVKAMKLQQVDPSNARLQKLASAYGERLRECVQSGRVRRPVSGHVIGHAHPSMSSDSPLSGGDDISPSSPTGGITLGHATGLRRFLFSGGRPRRASTNRAGPGAVRLAPRLSSSQSSV